MAIPALKMDEQDHTHASDWDLVSRLKAQEQFPDDLRVWVVGDGDEIDRIDSGTADARASLKRHRAELWIDLERSWWRGDMADCSRILTELSAWEARSLDVSATVELSVLAFLYRLASLI